MTDAAIIRMVERLCALPPLSPGFFAFRDDLAHFATSDSVRLHRAVDAVAHCSDYLAELAPAWRLTERWARMLELRSAVAATGPERPKAKRSWFTRRAKPAAGDNADFIAEIVASIAELTAARDRILHQIVAIDRTLRELDRAEQALQATSASLAALREVLDAQAQDLANPALAQAIGREIVPAAVQREQALQFELALAARARLELAAIQQGNDTLVTAMEQAISAARFVGSTAEAAGHANRDLDSVRREQQALRDALSLDATAAHDHPHLIDPAQSTGAQVSLASLNGALAGVAAARAQLDMAQARLGTLASEGLRRARS